MAEWGSAGSPVLWREHSSSGGPEEGGRAAALFFPSVEEAAGKHRWTVCLGLPGVSTKKPHDTSEKLDCNTMKASCKNKSLMKHFTLLTSSLYFNI